ncbi:hypothetical protein MSAN_02057600 [Mycena sanguinolenta]|uniref:Uncharacterized protein n=1 Tax=Mycena sanguinolenta TaxID=230812 RepID=A0A8H6XI24_9AGAR|nr:hypothetical protein MSAN_02057600 [Mycena sanguinolenta]
MRRRRALGGRSLRHTIGAVEGRRARARRGDHTRLCFVHSLLFYLDPSFVASFPSLLDATFSYRAHRLRRNVSAVDWCRLLSAIPQSGLLIYCASQHGLLIMQHGSTCAAQFLLLLWQPVTRLRLQLRARVYIYASSIQLGHSLSLAHSLSSVLRRLLTRTSHHDRAPRPAYPLAAVAVVFQYAICAPASRGVPCKWFQPVRSALQIQLRCYPSAHPSAHLFTIHSSSFIRKPRAFSALEATPPSSIPAPRLRRASPGLHPGSPPPLASPRDHPILALGHLPQRSHRDASIYHHSAQLQLPARSMASRSRACILFDFARVLARRRNSTVLEPRPLRAPFVRSPPLPRARPPQNVTRLYWIRFE